MSKAIIDDRASHLTDWMSVPESPRPEPVVRTVFVVDDDEQSRASICALAESMGLSCLPFGSAEQFLDEYQEGRRGCVVTDLRLRGLSGLELQETVARRQWPLPVVMVTAYPRTATTVRAVKNGAIAVLEKPYHEDELWEAIRVGMAEEPRLHAMHQRRRELHARMEQLTTDERKVMDMLVEGRPNKSIAQELGVSLRTVENRRHAVFTKMRAGSIAELVRMFMEASG
jgi:two-component system, LuxR family, response regulator FixJ